MIDLLETKRAEIAALCARHRVSRLAVFGSALRDDFQPRRSDFDFLVEFSPMDPYERADAYFGLLDALRALLGSEVDLVVAEAVKNPYIAANIEKTKQVLYAA
jgi:hypothetical protein